MDEKDYKMPLILRTSPTDVDYAHYYFTDELAAVREAVRKKRYRVGETDTAYRVISHWDQIGLIPDEMKNKDGGWRTFSIVERVWLEAIKRLRVFGISLDMIVKIRAKVMWWNEKMGTYPDFEYFMVKAWLSDMDTYILVLANGDADVGPIHEIELSKKLRPHQDMLLISLKSILKEMGMNVKEARTLFSLSDAEIELLTKIHVEGSNEVRIKTDDEGGIIEMESTHITTDPPPNYELQKQLKDEGMYGKVVTKYENGKSRSVQIKKRQRFEKKKE